MLLEATLTLFKPQHHLQILISVSSFEEIVVGFEKKNINKGLSFN